MFVGLHTGLVVKGDGATITANEVRGARIRTAIAYLVLNRGRPLPTTELAHALWRDDLPDSWSSSLREVLCRVRRLLANAGHPEAVMTRDGCVRLELQADVVVDVEQAIATANRIAVDAQSTSEVVALEALMASFTDVAAVHGAGVLPGDDGGWIVALRRQVDDARGAAALALASALLEAGRADAALQLAQEVVGGRPLDEQAHVLAMRSLVALGRVTGALEWFEQCRAAMAEAYGVDPSPALRALHLDILRGGVDPPVGLATVDTTLTTPPDDVWARVCPPRRDLGFHLPLVARADVIRRVAAALRRQGEQAPGNSVAVVVIAGERGTGRSRLLYELATGGHLPRGTVTTIDCTLEALGDAAAIRAALPNITADRRGQVAAVAATAVRQRRGPGALTILVDDADLARPVTRRFLVETVRGQHASAVHIVLTAVPADDGPTAVLLRDLRLATSVEWVDLPALAEADVAAIVAAWTDDAPSPAQAAALTARSGGLPLLLAPLLTADDHARSGAVGLAVVDLLSRLSAGARGLLADAAMCGEAFTPWDIATRSLPVDPLALVEVFEEVLARQLLVDDPRTGAMQFRHGAVREVLRADDAAARRHGLRARLAVVGPPDGDDPPTLRPVGAANRRPAGSPTRYQQPANIG